MKRLIILISLIAALTLPGFSDNGREHQQHQHQHQHYTQEQVANASTYVAICSKGDLHARFASRAQAQAAARQHQQQTGHRTGVRKQ